MAGLELMGLCAGLAAVCALMGAFAAALAGLYAVDPGPLRVFTFAGALCLLVQLDALALARALWSNTDERLDVAERAVSAFEQYGPALFDPTVKAYADYADFADPLEKLVTLRDNLREPVPPVGWGALAIRWDAAHDGTARFLVALSAIAGCLLTALGAAFAARLWLGRATRP